MLSSSTNDVIVIAPSLNEPYCTVPLNVPLTAPVILPELICKTLSVSVEPNTVALLLIFWFTCK